MLRQRMLAAVVGLPTLFLLLWGNALLRAGTLRIAQDDLLILLIVLIITIMSGWEISTIVRHRFPGAAPWNGVYAVVIAPFLIHTVHPGGAAVSNVSLLIDSVGATAAVMLLFLGIWGDAERRGREGLFANLFIVLAAGYVGLTTSSLILLGASRDHEWVVALLFVCIFALDTFAYFGGKHFGGSRMVPAISPNKTWSGSISGFAAACLFSLLFLWSPLGSALHWWELLALGASIGIVGQVGDLMESRFKRWGGVKDSGNALPGHGGFLDRFDSFFLAAPVFTLLYLLLLHLRG